MTDYANFKYGAVKYPLAAASNGSSLLHDVDPALFYMLEFYRTVLEVHLKPRFMSEVLLIGASQISTMVKDILPSNPEPYIHERHTPLPLLSAYRSKTSFEWTGSSKVCVDEIEVCYILPPLQAAQAHRLIPILKGIVSVLDNRTEQGADPQYTPTMPLGTAGEAWWKRAGIVSASVKKASYGGFAISEDVYLPAVTLTVEVKEQSKGDLDSYEYFEGGTASIDLYDSAQQTTVTDIAQVTIFEPPTLSIVSPISGSKAGGTTVTLTGTDFRTGATYSILFGGVPATSVVAINATTIQCVTPAHDAYPTYLADVVVTDPDGQSASLPAAYTFT